MFPAHLRSRWRGCWRKRPARMPCLLSTAGSQVGAACAEGLVMVAGFPRLLAVPHQSVFLLHHNRSASCYTTSQQRRGGQLGISAALPMPAYHTLEHRPPPSLLPPALQTLRAAQAARRMQAGWGACAPTSWAGARARATKPTSLRPARWGGLLVGPAGALVGSRRCSRCAWNSASCSGRGRRKRQSCAQPGSFGAHAHGIPGSESPAICRHACLSVPRAI